jgi:hypothetical protein
MQTPADFRRAEDGSLDAADGGSSSSSGKEVDDDAPPSVS